MAGSSLWRIIPAALIALLALMLPGSAQAKAGCPSPAQNAASYPTPVQSTTELVSAPAIPVWKTITIGELAGVNAVRPAMDAAPCAINIGDWADEILGRPAFPFRRVKTELDLVVVAVAQLGFGAQGAALGHIHERAISFGLELCPAEVGPILRLSYLDQRTGEFLHIAMLPVARYSGELVDFTLGNGGAGLLLIGGDARPEIVLPGSVRFVFVKPRPSTVVASGTRSEL
jgi:hypothetical protein